jgi:hypothetical protein
MSEPFRRRYTWQALPFASQWAVVRAPCLCPLTIAFNDEPSPGTTIASATFRSPGIKLRTWPTGPSCRSGRGRVCIGSRAFFARRVAGPEFGDRQVIPVALGRAWHGRAGVAGSVRKQSRAAPVPPSDGRPFARGAGAPRIGTWRVPAGGSSSAASVALTVAGASDCIHAVAGASCTRSKQALVRSAAEELRDLADVPVEILAPRASSTAFVPGDAPESLHFRKVVLLEHDPAIAKLCDGSLDVLDLNLMHVVFDVPAN